MNVICCFIYSKHLDCSPSPFLIVVVCQITIKTDKKKSDQKQVKVSRIFWERKRRNGGKINHQQFAFIIMRIQEKQCLVNITAVTQQIEHHTHTFGPLWYESFLYSKNILFTKPIKTLSKSVFSSLDSLFCLCQNYLYQVRKHL